MSRNSLSTEDLEKKLPSWVQEIPPSNSSNDIPLMRHCSEDSFTSNESSCSLTLDKSSTHSSQEHQFDWCPSSNRSSDSSNASSSDSVHSIIENLPLHEVPEMEESETSIGSSSPTYFSPHPFRKKLANKDDVLRRWSDSADVSLPTWIESDCSSSSDSSPPTSANTCGLDQILEEEDSGLEEETPRKVFHANPQRERSAFSVAVLIFCAISVIYYYFSRCTLAENLKNSRELLAYTQKLGLQLKIAQKDVELMELELASLDEIDAPATGLEDPSSSEAWTKALADPERMREMITVQRSLKRSQYQSEHLKEIVKETSKADAISTYGAVTKRVRIELAFPDDQDFAQGVGSSHANIEPTVFVIEMAPIDLMPHSVYTFLEMASAGLLDGCSFILNAMHVLKAAPLPYDGTPPSIKAQEFLDKGLESVAFREYSADYPHKQYTVGFAADGSPSFYINTEDNSEIHAGYPCFAKVVSGFETIHRLEASPTRNGLWLEQRVGIKKVTVL
ncbi:unnamed protein product [Cylindrotheca closterium]|uniref:PPIase cyclophilin-type domain-containing protein n=1 Tax=Cylindrotheca closterium TaxID=2856 RepID=A0AAD2FLP1_9STRA|nr:unnamed protein product [Cylindrotheca closterium]